MRHRSRVDNSSIVVQLLYFNPFFFTSSAVAALLSMQRPLRSDDNSSYNDKGKAHGTEI